MAVFAGAAAPTPLYRLYQEQWNTSPVMITIIFGIYAISLLLALLFAGSISDHIGRRPTIFAALVLQSLSMITFILAEGTGFLLAARIFQGFATGIAASSIGAALADSSRKHGSIVNSLSPLIGMSIGGTLSGLLVAYGPFPTQLIYEVMFCLYALLAISIWRIPETVTPRPGILASLKPTVFVPPQARRALLFITPVIIALWTLGGFYMSLVPSLIAKATGIQSPLMGGLMVTLLMGSGAIVVFLQRNRAPISVLAFGSGCLVIGVGLLVLGIHLGHVPLLIVASLVLGAGMGSNFLASVGTILPLAEPHQRAELLAVFYIECYLSMCLPAILAGISASSIGITRTADLFTAATVLLTLAGFLGVRATSPRPVRQMA